MFELTFLGTAASVPSPARALPALLVRHGSKRFLVDCGEGTQRQLMASGLGFRRLETVLLTHGHLDHLLGLGGLVGTMSLWRSVSRLTVHGGDDALALARRLIEGVCFPRGGPRFALAFAPLAPGLVMDLPDLTVTAFPVSHAGTLSFGFRFDEPMRHAVDADRLAALGVPEGPERRRLAQGEAVVLADGRAVTPEAVSAGTRRGASLAVVGDCGSTAGLAAHLAGADALVIEATFGAADAEEASERGHLTAAGAARLAAEAGVGRLCLTHISHRSDPAALAAEASQIFPAVQVMNDFDTVRVECR